MGRRLAARWPVAAGAFALAVFPGTGSAEPAPGNRGAFVLSLAAAPDGIYAVERAMGCERDCERLVRTSDGGRSWQRLAARGWSTSDVIATVAGGGTVLLSPGADGVQVSRDGGASFVTVPAPAASVVPAGDGTAFLGGEDGSAALIDLVSLRVTALPRLPLRNVRVVPHPAYPAVPAGEPYAVVSGNDPETDFPVVARCDARWDCAARTVVVPREDGPRAYVSPAFARDRTIVVTLARGGLYVSSDGGATFVPQVVTAPRPGEVIASFPAVAFVPTGQVYAAVITAATDGGMAGGVFASGRDGRWARVGGAGPPDGGASAVTLTEAGTVYAAYVAPPAGGVVCAAPSKPWAASCAVPKPRQAAPVAPGSAAGGRPVAGRTVPRVPASAAPASGEALAVPRERVLTERTAARDEGGVAWAPFAIALVVAATGALVWRRDWSG